MPLQEAYLRFNDTLYVATCDEITQNRSHTAITRLIQGIYELDPRMARKILRNRIYATASATSFCRAMVKVAAKRLTDNTAPLTETERARAIVVDFKSELNHEIFDTRFRSTEEVMVDLNERLNSRKVTSKANRYENDRAVAAALFSTSERPLVAFNTNAKNRTLHAEMNLVQSILLERGSPYCEPISVLVTLKPCKMCAEALTLLVENPKDLRVVYLEEDPGPNARYSRTDYPIESLRELQSSGSIELKRENFNSSLHSNF